MNELDVQIELCKNIERGEGDYLDCGELAGKVKAGDMSIDEMKSIGYKGIFGILRVESGAVDVVDISNDGDMGEYLTEKFEGVPVLAVEQDGKICEVDIMTGEAGDCAEPFSEE